MPYMKYGNWYIPGCSIAFQQNEKPGNILKANNNGAMEIPCKSPIP